MGAYIKPEEVERARQIDLLTYLRQAQPDELVHKGGGHYSTKSHDSLDISNGFWKRWSTGDGGKSAVDYLIKVEGFSFQEAVQKVNSLSGFQVWDVRPVQRQPPPKKAFVLPEKNGDNRRAVAYLRSRGIHPNVIQHCLQRNTLYEDKNHNAVFVGYCNGQAKYAFRRGTGGVDFKREAAGSEKKYGFSIAENKQAKVLHVYECAIDLLSFCTMCEMAGRDWRQEFHLSQGGVAAGSKNAFVGAALEEFLSSHPGIQKVYLRYDNDKAGREAAEAAQCVLRQKYGIETEVRPPRRGKDYNEYLQEALKNLQNRERSPIQISSLRAAENRTVSNTVKKQGPMR